MVCCALTEMLVRVVCLLRGWWVFRLLGGACVRASVFAGLLACLTAFACSLSHMLVCFACLFVRLFSWAGCVAGWLLALVASLYTFGLGFRDSISGCLTRHKLAQSVRASMDFNFFVAFFVGRYFTRAPDCMQVRAVVPPGAADHLIRGQECLRNPARPWHRKWSFLGFSEVLGLRDRICTVVNTVHSALKYSSSAGKLSG